MAKELEVCLALEGREPEVFRASAFSALMDQVAKRIDGAWKLADGCQYHIHDGVDTRGTKYLGRHLRPGDQLSFSIDKLGEVELRGPGEEYAGYLAHERPEEDEAAASIIGRSLAAGHKPLGIVREITTVNREWANGDEVYFSFALAWIPAPGTTFEELMDVAADKLHGTWLHAKIAGITHRNQDGTSRQDAANELGPMTLLTLVREPGNPHDPYAIQIFTPSGDQLGYVPNWLAGDVARSMDRGKGAVCAVKYVGVLDDGTLGVAVGIAWA